MCFRSNHELHYRVCLTIILRTRRLTFHHQHNIIMKYLSPLILALLVSSLEAGSLDLMELNTVQYNVEILDTPVTDTQDMSEVRS